MIDITQDEKLTALTIEARRRGITYGRLMASTTPAEREHIFMMFLLNKHRAKKKKEIHAG